MNELKALMVDGSNVDKVDELHLEFQKALNEFYQVHESVQLLLSDDVKENERIDWFEPKRVTFTEFLNELELWKKKRSDPQTLVDPSDSVSNVSRSSKGSSKSRTSSIMSARVKLAADKAALLARAEALKKKHAFELEKAQLESKMEALALQSEIDAANAKLKVLEISEASSLHSSHSSAKLRDAMNEYADKAEEKSTLIIDSESSPLHFKTIGAIPKTPLQRIVHGTQIPSRLTANQAATAPTTTTTQTDQQHGAARNTTNASLDLGPVLQRQSDLADLLETQQKQASLPLREIPVFSGDPLEYRPFMRSFIHNIEEKTDNSQERLYYLEQFTAGEPKELVRSCLYMNASRGYAEAKHLLKHHFGDEFKLASAYMEKALKWGNIRSDDGKALYSYAVYLRGCCNAAQDLTQLMKTQKVVQQMIQDRIKKIQDIKHLAEFRKTQLVKTKDVQQMIQDRIEKIQDIKHSAELRKIYSSLCSPTTTRNWPEISIDTTMTTLRRALTQLQDTLNEKLSHSVTELKWMQQYAVLFNTIFPSLPNKIQLMKTQKDVQQMIQDRIKKIQGVKHSAEVRKIYSSLCSPTNTRNWPEISMKTHKNLETLGRALTQLQDTLNKKLSHQAIELKWMQQYAELNVYCIEMTQLMKTQKDVQQMIQDRIKKIQDIKLSAKVRKIYTSLCSPTNTKNWSEISMKNDKSMMTLRRALTQLQDTLDEKLSHSVTGLKWMQQYADLKWMQQYAGNGVIKGCLIFGNAEGNEAAHSRRGQGDVGRVEHWGMSWCDSLMSEPRYGRAEWGGPPSLKNVIHE
ncbi:hypothetical protein ROHU_010970 [Labeo rohita]|uniref:Uncharacterized protein n=1 Tax=Labeo rohita TaxID=84645 RepID=A0A498LP39_LABRO|nr:hypothetical protein ROHU_010970 [Labeo rohita]